MSRSLQEQYATGAAPEVDLYRDPASLLSRDYDGGRIVIPEADFGGVYPERVTVELAPFEVELLRSVTSGRISTRQPVSGTLRAELSEEEVSRIVRVYGPGLPGVEIEEGRVVAVNEVAALGQSVPVSVWGSVSVQYGALVFEPGQMAVADVELPGLLVGELLQGTSFAYPIEGLPPGVVITGARAEEGRLVLTGEVDGLQVG